MLKVLSFRLADGLFGIEITNVKEINRNIEYTAVPRAPETIVGLFNMRGQVVTLFNLASILGYNSEVKKEKATCIILKSGAGSPDRKGFIIDCSGDVVDVSEDMCEPPPANVNTRERKYIKTVVRLEKELLRIVDPDVLFEE